MTIRIDKSKDDLLADYAVGMLKDFYLTEYESSPQEAYKRAATAWSKYNPLGVCFISKMNFIEKRQLVLRYREFGDLIRHK